MGGLLLMMVCFSVLSLYIGNEGSYDFELTVEIKSFNNPYYELGISFRGHEIEGDDNTFEQELIIGLFFFNIVFTFRKNRA